jgi:hypothetical protein
MTKASAIRFGVCRWSGASKFSIEPEYVRLPVDGMLLAKLRLVARAETLDKIEVWVSTLSRKEEPMTELQHAPEVIIALYDALADVEAALSDLEQAGVPYPSIRMGAHTADDHDLPALEATQLPERFWSLRVLIEQRGRYGAEQILRAHGPLAIGRMPAPDAGRDETDHGAIAWRHYVFETSAATDAVGEFAGTTGNTGIISSGVFANDALAEGNPPVRGQAGSHGRPASEQQRPSTDTMRPTTSTDDARPDNELRP